METHPFQPDENNSPSCARCLMGAGNRVHAPSTSTGNPPPVQPEHVVARMERGVSAAFHELWGTMTPRARVFYEIAACSRSGGATDDELMHKPDLSDMPQNTVRPRRVELEQAGLVCRMTDGHGRTVRRVTTSGRPAQVWTVTAAARDLIRAAPMAAAS